MREPNLIELSVHEIENTAGTQVRKVLDKKVIAAYAEWYQSGALFPALVVFAEDGSERYILADGFHRLEAAKQAGLETISCDLYEGGSREALAFALGANYDHGVPRTAKDLRNAIEIACKDPVWHEWSDRQIAALCRTTHKTVGKIRNQLGIKKPDKVKTKRTKKDGSPVEMKVVKQLDTSPDGISNLNKANRKAVTGAIREVMAMPMNGTEAVERLGLTQDHRADIEYCVEWFTEALVALGGPIDEQQAS